MLSLGLVLVLILQLYAIGQVLSQAVYPYLSDTKRQEKKELLFSLSFFIKAIELLENPSRLPP